MSGNNPHTPLLEEDSGLLTFTTGDIRVADPE